MKILVADDETVSLTTLKAFATRLGYDVLAASDGEAAYRVWERERPGIVVTDWEMPGMSGLELCARIRAEMGEDYTYIIVVTGRGNTEDVIQGMEAGADDYIAKPFNRDELGVRIRAGERVLRLQTKDVVIFALAKLAESRDQDTGSHLERVRHYSRLLADTVYNSPWRPQDLDQQMIHNIFMTSPLHDIGKVGIPDRILLKPGRLTEPEFDLMKTHTTIGADTLMGAYEKAPHANYLKVAAEIARHHHEKYDGSGYPDGLTGEAISLPSRIFALADVYDALRTPRPYKGPFSHDKAKAIIVEGRGSHFDPMVVDAFLSCQEAFDAIFGQYA
jgi:putative two-component system response regulator